MTAATISNLADRKALVRTFVADVWNGNDLDAIDELATPDIVVHGLGAGVDRSRDEFVEFHGGLLDAVPDLTHDVRTLVAENDQVVAYVTIRGTPERQYGALSPTGKTFETVGFQLYRIERDRIAAVSVLPNAMGMLQQLGVFPDSPAQVLRLVAAAFKGQLVQRWRS